jgi:hypothetical protein
MLKLFKLLLFISLILLLLALLPYNNWQSGILYFNTENKLEYIRDNEGNLIPDFSFAGYKNSNEEIPDIETVKTISPIEGDNTELINNAIEFIATHRNYKVNGFKGAVQLMAGTYNIYGTINLNRSGIVLRGVGNNDDASKNTILIAKGDSPHQRSVIVLGGRNSTRWRKEIPNTRTLIVSDTILIGERTFNVEDATAYNIGDNIIIYHPCTDKWLQSINYGGTHSTDSGADPNIDKPWEIDSQPIVFNRYITNIENNSITIDVPVYNTLIKELSQSYIYKYDNVNIKRNIGIENLRIEIETSGNPEDENHAWTAIDFIQVEDAWSRNCVTTNFGLSGFRTNTATRITIDNCSAINPVSIITGGRRYNFNAHIASQQILFNNCFASNGRHHYCSNGMSWTSGIVFYNCKSSGAYASSESHRRWSMGILWDNHQEIDGPRNAEPVLLALYNRGYYGTSHGWACVNSVAWNCNVNNGYILVQKPPTGQNYAIGCFGKKVSGYAGAKFTEPEGYIEGTNKNGLIPQSLFLAQLNERKGIPPSRVQKKILINEFLLKQNFPNPFNNSTNIKIILNHSGYYSLNIYNSLGEKIHQIFNGHLNKGKHNFLLNIKKVSAGVYFYRLKGNNTIKTKKMVFLP